jgi:preprotein translocase subunit SecG
MTELLNPLTFLLLVNSIITITLVLNQNDSAKDSTSVQNSAFVSNPLEKFTWICLFFQLILLLLKTKITDF